MRCANCGFENPSGASFCDACGARLSCSCLRCGHEARLSDKFCSECGAPLTNVPAAPSPPPGLFHGLLQRPFITRPTTLPSASAPNRQPWKPGARPPESVRPSRHCLPTWPVPQH
ncbi:zinc ribbon domain-containing protein [Pseudomonas frederiksbergensis]|nr:zinc ribbon domain-containing protein [Pseudomonas frederiksbergensis]